MRKKRVIGIGETVLDILFKNDQPIKVVPGGSTFNSIVSLGRAGVDCAMVTEVAIQSILLPTAWLFWHFFAGTQTSKSRSPCI